jgi:hypothetical protein
MALYECSENNLQLLQPALSLYDCTLAANGNSSSTYTPSSLEALEMDIDGELMLWPQ